MTMDRILPNWLVSFVVALWRFRNYLIIAFLSSVILANLALDYLDHRKERAVALQAAYSELETSEATLIEILSRTTPMWQTGIPVEQSVLEDLAEASLHVYLSVEGVNRPNSGFDIAAENYLSAIATLRSVVTSHGHDEASVRRLQEAIKQYAISKDNFNKTVERQIENYNRSLFALI